MKTIVIIDAEKYAEVVSTVEVVLDRKFEGASLTTLLRAVEARISELEGPARQEDQSGAISLEIRVLNELLESLTSTGGVPVSRTTLSSGY
jgi:hypothetical protein